MTIALSSPITGAAQTGFTAPTYTLTADTPPANNAKQWTVSALGGTQTGASVHSVGSRFLISCWKPVVYKQLGKANPVTGVISNVLRNSYKIVTIKGCIPLAGQPTQSMQITSTIDVPAGTDLASPSELRAALSAHIGALSQQSAGIGDTLITGVLG